MHLINGRTIEYEYDAVGNITKVNTASGTTIYTYDEQNRLETVTDSDNQVTTYSYNAVGNLHRTQFPNGVIETRTYDEVNRLELLKYSRVNASGTEVTFASFDYALDLAGHRRVVTEQDGRKVEYAYDDLYRLTKETIFNASGTVERTIAYTYDAVGNRLNRTDSVEGITTYIYDSNDRLQTEELRIDGALQKTVTYSYDANGNTTSEKTQLSDGTISEVIYTWDKENRLIGVEKPGHSLSYTYDVDGVRVSSTVDGVRTDYLVDKNLPYAQVLAEYGADGELKASYVYGNDLISQERGGESSFYLVDGLGSTRGLTDGSGVVTDNYTYDSFGNAIATTGGTDNSYLFAGEQYDAGLGDYYLRARYYDPQVGRFTRRDDYEGSFSNPVTLHKYIYANADPVNGVDPTGLFTATMEPVLSRVIEGIYAALYYFTPTLLYQRFVTSLAIASFLAVYGIFLAANTSGDDEDTDAESDTKSPSGDGSQQDPGKKGGKNQKGKEPFGKADPNISIEKQLQGKGQLPDLRKNPNWDENISINEVLRKTPDELIEMVKKRELSPKGLKQIQKAFEGRDLGKRGGKKK